MTRCIVCHRQKSPKSFQGEESTVCQSCIRKLSEDYTVDYAPPEKVTKLDAFVNLLKASRDMAVEDDALEEWESVFLLSREWQMIWILLKKDQLWP